ncbi:hypothetical protein [Yokenella regensburgei]|uniref:hypothetical protein n=1 Tax=Yokenella regensburgei TaxID=158877 RepID=UPI001433435D|nr:hypothetical protein [Yokenella regensburgei]QIU88446.1 hypothetical protein HEC60_03265 [Yokenella regensburgei]
MAKGKYPAAISSSINALNLPLTIGDNDIETEAGGIRRHTCLRERSRGDNVNVIDENNGYHCCGAVFGPPAPHK